MSSANANFVHAPETKRERAPIACLTCRGKKLKCVVENGKTRCKTCIKSNVEHCVFTPVSNEQETRFTRSSQGPYTTQQFRVERPTDYANQLPNAQPTQSSVHSWSIHGGNAVATPSQRAPSSQLAPPLQASQRVSSQQTPAYQATASIYPQYTSHEPYLPSGQYDAYPRQPQHQHQAAPEMYRFDNTLPGSWVPGTPSNYPNQETAFPVPFSDPLQSMSAPSSGSMHPPYGHADPNFSWSGNASANFYYPERSNDEHSPFHGQGSM